METSKPLLSFKLKVAEVVIEYEMKFKHLGLELSGFGDVETKVREQITKATKIVHHASIKERPVIIYTAETRPKTKRLLEITEIKDLRKITGRTISNRQRSERNTYRIESINGWVSNRKEEWNEHIKKMDAGA